MHSVQASVIFTLNLGTSRFILPPSENRSAAFRAYRLSDAKLAQKNKALLEVQLL
jgi:hypothetical protein